MADTPDFLTLEHHRDLRGRERRPIVRWTLLGVLGGLCAFALANAYGQRPDTDVQSGGGATLEIYSPKRLRGGLYFESRFTIHAEREIENATLVLDPGWLEGMTLNTLEPAPIGEASRDGRLALELGHVPAGKKHVFFLQFQVNPTNVGHRAQNVVLQDGETPLLSVERTVTVFP